jgi:hypothetical protein
MDHVARGPRFDGRPDTADVDGEVDFEGAVVEHDGKPSFSSFHKSMNLPAVPDRSGVDGATFSLDHGYCVCRASDASRRYGEVCSSEAS